MWTCIDCIADAICCGLTNVFLIGIGGNCDRHCAIFFALWFFVIHLSDSISGCGFDPVSKNIASFLWIFSAMSTISFITSSRYSSFSRNASVEKSRG